MKARTEVFTLTVPTPADPSAPPDEQEKTDALNELLGADDRYENLHQLGDYLSVERSDRDLAQLLGYTDVLRKLRSKMVTGVEEQSLQSDLSKERYFIIVRAYELRSPTVVQPREARVDAAHERQFAGKQFPHGDEPDESRRPGFRRSHLQER